MAEVLSLTADSGPKNPEFATTPTARDVFNLLAVCQYHRLLGTIAGNPGVGKSTAINAFKRGHGDACGEVFLCRMTKTAQNLQPGLVRIADAMSVFVAPNASAYEVHEAICQDLSRTDTPLLILDEAQNMSDELLEAVRDIYDDRSAPVGVVLVGHRDLGHRWGDDPGPSTSGRSGRRAAAKFAQLRGRIGPRLRFDKPRREDVDAICAGHGISGDQARKLIRDAAGLPGGLHHVGNLIAQAADLADGHAITVEHVKQAKGLMGVR